MKEKRKPLKMASLNEPEDAKVIAETIKEPVVKSNHNSVSPLLSDPIDIMDHAKGAIPNPSVPKEDPVKTEGFKADTDIFSNTPKPEFKMPDLPQDAPEQVFSTSTFIGSPNPPAPEGSTPIDDAAKQAASDLADTITEMYKRAVPELVNGYTKIQDKDIKAIKNYEKDGDLLPGIANDLTENNKENKAKLVERAKSDVAMIKKPLAKLLQSKNIEAPPHIELIIVLVFVAATYFMLAREIKQSNNDLLSKIYEKINANKPKQESDIPLTPT